MGWGLCCQSNILSYKLGHFIELLHVLGFYLEQLNISLSPVKISQKPKTLLQHHTSHSWLWVI